MLACCTRTVLELRCCVNGHIVPPCHLEANVSDRGLDVDLIKSKKPVEMLVADAEAESDVPSIEDVLPDTP